MSTFKRYNLKKYQSQRFTQVKKIKTAELCTYVSKRFRTKNCRAALEEGKQSFTYTYFSRDASQPRRQEVIYSLYPVNFSTPCFNLSLYYYYFQKKPALQAASPE